MTSRVSDKEQITYSELCSDFPIFNCATNSSRKFVMSETSICLAPWFSSSNDILPLLRSKGKSSFTEERKSDYYKDLCRLEEVYGVFKQGDVVAGVDVGPGSLVSFLNDRLGNDYKATLSSQRDYDFSKNITGTQIVEVIYGTDGVGEHDNVDSFCTYVIDSVGKADVFFGGSLQGFREALGSLRLLKEGGSCVYRIPSLRNSTVVEALYLLSLSFKKVVLFKPAMSEGETSYFYGREFVDRGLYFTMKDHVDSSTMVRVPGDFENWISYIQKKMVDTRKRTNHHEYNQTLLESSFQPLY